MWPQKGGWEAWAQAQILSEVLRIDSRYEILREQHVYESPRKAADFLLNGSSPVPQMTIVELKCQSLENHAQFSAGLANDARKLVYELSPAFHGATLLILGIYFTGHGTIPAFFDSEVLGDGEVGICTAIDENSQ